MAEAPVGRVAVVARLDRFLAVAPLGVEHRALVPPVEEGIGRRRVAYESCEEREEPGRERQGVVEAVELRHHLEERRSVALRNRLHSADPRQTPYSLNHREAGPSETVN